MILGGLEPPASTLLGWRDNPYTTRSISPLILRFDINIRSHHYTQASI